MFTFTSRATALVCIPFFAELLIVKSVLSFWIKILCKRDVLISLGFKSNNEMLSSQKTFSMSVYIHIHSKMHVCVYGIDPIHIILPWRSPSFKTDNHLAKKKKPLQCTFFNITFYHKPMIEQELDGRCSNQSPASRNFWKCFLFTLL